MYFITRNYVTRKSFNFEIGVETESHKKIAFHQSNSETRQEKEDYRGASNESYLYS